MNYCAACRGRKEIRRPVMEPRLVRSMRSMLSEARTVTYRTVDEPCTECWGTGWGVRYDIVAERRPSLFWMQNEITRLLQGGKPEEMERVIGTAIGYDETRWTLVGVKLKCESIADLGALRSLCDLSAGTTPWASVKYMYVDFKVLLQLPTLPDGWTINVRERTV